VYEQIRSDFELSAFTASFGNREIGVGTAGEANPAAQRRISRSTIRNVTVAVGGCGVAAATCANPIATVPLYVYPFSAMPPSS
jgi:hypothetical protein